jgi:hypothetical protein
VPDLVPVVGHGPVCGEDTRDDLPYGGWAKPYSSDAMGRVLARRTGEGAMLFGRRACQDFAGFWPQQPPNPFDDRRLALELTGAEPTTTGVVITTYRPATGS